MRQNEYLWSKVKPLRHQTKLYEYLWSKVKPLRHQTKLNILGLTFNHTIQTLNDPKEELRLSKTLSTLSTREIIILATFNLSSANAFNLVMSEILSLGIRLRLNLYHTMPGLNDPDKDGFRKHCGKWKKKSEMLLNLVLL